ncbi:MAG: hypothetical protein E7Z86_00015 [Methanosphaera stadtmanae]|nr:hypothetical protein [Methanosphaera stadtmanae]
MSWKELFDETRLNRGYDYFVHGNVFDVVIDDNGVSAKVEGSHKRIYNVSISFSNNMVDEVSCTCPYHYSNKYCKHLVAVLYKYDEIESSKNASVDDSYQQELFVDILSNVDDASLRRFVYDFYRSDETFVNRFFAEFESDYSIIDVDSYMSMLDDIFKVELVELYNRQGFYEESPFERYLQKFIDSRIANLYAKGHTREAKKLLFTIVSRLSEKVDNAEFVDVDSILVSCDYYLSRIFNGEDTSGHDESFNYLISNLSFNYNEYTASHIIRWCIRYFNSSVYYGQLDSVLDDILSSRKVGEEVILLRYQLMNLMKYPSVEMDTFLKKYNYFEAIMDLLIAKALDEKNYLLAIDYLLENEKIHGEFYSLDNTLSLIELYELTENWDKCILKLKSVIFDFGICDMDYVNKIKQYSGDDWNKHRNEIIEFYMNKHEYEFLNQIYVEETMYEQLYVNVTKNCPIGDIERYRKYIIEGHVLDILDIYRKFILDQAKTAKHSGAYTVIINYLNVMLSYKYSDKIVSDLIDVLLNKYKNKKLLVEELNEIKQNMR